MIIFIKLTGLNLHIENEFVHIFQYQNLSINSSYFWLEFLRNHICEKKINYTKEEVFESSLKQNSLYISKYEFLLIIVYIYSLRQGSDSKPRILVFFFIFSHKIPGKLFYWSNTRNTKKGVTRWLRGESIYRLSR